MIKHNFVDKSKETVMVIVRPHLEYCTSAWNLHLDAWQFGTTATISVDVLQ